MTAALEMGLGLIECKFGLVNRTAGVWLRDLVSKGDKHCEDYDERRD